MEGKEPTSDNLTRTVEQLAEMVDRLDTEMIKRRKWWRSLLQGIIYGLGTAIGGTLVFGAIIYILLQFNAINYLGDYVSKIMDQVLIEQGLKK